jgi:hypothetical protein
MKRTLFFLTAVLMAGLFVVSCSTTGGVVIGAEGVPQPDWVSSRPQGIQYADTADEIYFVGRGSGNEMTRRQFALNNGLQALAIWKEGVTATVLKTYIEEYGEAENTQILVSSENAIVHVRANIAGVREVDSWIDENGQYVGLYQYPKNEFRNEFRTAMNTFAVNEAAADQMFRIFEQQLDVE